MALLESLIACGSFQTVAPFAVLSALGLILLPFICCESIRKFFFGAVPETSNFITFNT